MLIRHVVSEFHRESTFYPRDPYLLVWRDELATGRVTLDPEKSHPPLSLEHKTVRVAGL